MKGEGGQVAASQQINRLINDFSLSNSRGRKAAGRGKHDAALVCVRVCVWHGRGDYVMQGFG